MLHLLHKLIDVVELGLRLVGVLSRHGRRHHDHHRYRK